MALDDFRVWIDVASQDGRLGSVALEVTTQGKLQLHVVEAGHADVDGAAVDLDWSDAGVLSDALHEAMGILLARQGDPIAAAAVVGLQAARETLESGRDTPHRAAS